MKTFNLTLSYDGNVETWDEIRDDAENDKISHVFIGTKEFVNVVRCGECKYYYSIATDDKAVGKCCVYDGWSLAHENDFCSRGKRRSE